MVSVCVLGGEVLEITDLKKKKEWLQTQQPVCGGFGLPEKVNQKEKECLRCQLLTEVIDELSHELAKAQQGRRAAFRESLALKRLLLMDMEAEHEAISQADGFGDSA
jgi:hypothetical protein